MSVKALVVVEIDGTEQIFDLSAPTVRELKHKIYLLTFEDLAGENATALSNWKAANYIKERRSLRPSE
jgi:hypothetical protein